MALAIGVGTGAKARGSEQTDVEAWVLQCVARGEAADLGELGEPKGPRILRSEFVCHLLTATDTNVTHPRGVHLKRAVLTNQLVLLNTEVLRAATFSSCFFDASVEFTGSRFHRSLTFANCTFSNTVDFEDVKIDEHLKLDGSRFAYPVRCDYAEIGGGLDANGVSFGAPVDFSHLKVGYSARFNGAGEIFTGKFDPKVDATKTNDVLSYSRRLLAARNLSLHSAATISELMRFPGNHAANTNSAARIYWSIYDQDSLQAYTVAREDSEKDPSFQIKIERRTLFDGDANFDGASVGYRFEAAKAQFRGPANFRSFVVSDSAYCGWSEFLKGADLSFARVAGNLSLEYALFPAALVLYGAKIGGEAILTGGVLGGGIKLDDAVVDKNLQAHSTRFEGATHEASFFALEVGGSAYFNGAKFAGPVNFILGRIGGNFEVEDAVFSNGAELKELEAITAKRPVHFNADFGSLHVGGFAVFAQARFAGTVSFRNADFRNLHLENIEFQLGRNSVQMEGLAYKHIRAVAPQDNHDLPRIEQRISWEQLKRIIVSNVQFSADLYENVEKYFRSVGERDLADDVFVQRRWEEGKPPHASFWARVTNRILYWGIGYGKHPAWSFIWSLGVIMVGWVVFLPGTMTLRKPGEGAPRCNSFWYSLDLFAPIINLKIAEEWVPKLPATEFPTPGWRRLSWHVARWRWYYVKVHRILGWILVPFGIAGLTGILK